MNRDRRLVHSGQRWRPLSWVVTRVRFLVHRWLLLALLLLILPPGCREPKAKRQPAAKPQDRPSTVESSAVPPTTAAPAARTDDGPVETPQLTDPVHDSGAPDIPRNPADSLNASRAQPVLTAQAPYRLLILRPRGPLICDLQLTIDEHSHAQAVAAMTDLLLEAADLDEDRLVTWQEATTSPNLIYGQFGNPRLASEAERQQLVYRCDFNRNRRVDRDEVAAFLASDRQPSRWINVIDSSTVIGDGNDRPLFDWLDRNQDRVLDRSEVEQAAARLQLLDRDADGIVRRADIPDQPPAAERLVASAGPSLVLLRKTPDWSHILFQLEDYYAFGAPLQASDLPDRETLFLELDVDGDGSWSVDEIKLLQTRRPDITIHANWGEAVPALRVEGATAIAESSAEHRISLALGDPDLNADPDLDVRLVDNSPRIDSANERPPGWEQADQNHDGSLDRQEFASLADSVGLPFEAIDRNGDELVQPVEVLDAMQQRQAAQALRVSIALSVIHQPLWRRLDADRNGQLVERELRLAATDLRELGETLAYEHLPAVETLLLVRGDVTTIDPGQSPPRDSGPQPQAPEWFSPMDQNRDGEISRREFLGPAELFRRFDANADGALQVNELPSQQATPASEDATAPTVRPNARP